MSRSPPDSVTEAFLLVHSVVHAFRSDRQEFITCITVSRDSQGVVPGEWVSPPHSAGGHPALAKGGCAPQVRAAGTALRSRRTPALPLGARARRPAQPRALSPASSVAPPPRCPRTASAALQTRLDAPAPCGHQRGRPTPAARLPSQKRDMPLRL